MYHDLRQYDRCSTNNACVYFLLAGYATSGICGPIDVACNQLVPCENSNYTCSMPDHVCIYHPRCNFLPVCYPTKLTNEKRCQSTEDKNSMKDLSLLYIEKNSSHFFFTIVSQALIILSPRVNIRHTSYQTIQHYSGVKNYEQMDQTLMQALRIT